MKRRLGCFKFALASIVFVLGAVGGRYKWANLQPVVTIPPPTPLPSPNGFDLYVQAAQSFKLGAPPVDEIYDREATQLTEAQKTQRYSLPRKQQWLASNAVGLALFERALHADSRQPSSRQLNDPMPETRKLRELARYKVVQSKTLQAQQKWLAAAHARLDVIEMAGDVMRGGGLIYGLLGIACEAIALNEFEKLIPHLSAAECKQLNTRFEKLWSARPLFSELLTEEKYSYQSTLLKTWAQADASHRGLFIPSAKAVLISLFMTRRSIIENNEQMMNAFIAEADKPYRARHIIPEPEKLFDGLNGIIFPPLERSLFNSTRSLGSLQNIQLRLALRQYRLEKGSYPTSLKQLVPVYLTKLPVDPYGAGQPWLYKKTGDSYRAWSIGPDGKSNGGQPILPKKRQKKVVIWTDSIGDVVATP